jgi:phage gp37-like protein
VIAEIEDAIINAVRSASLGYRLAEVASYGGQYDEDLSQVVRSFPAVWVVFGGSAKPQKMGPDKWKVPCTFVVLVGSRSVAKEAATRKGDTAGSPGTYRMLEDVAGLLVGQDLGQPIAEFEPGAVKTLFSTRLNGHAVSVFSQEFHTAYIQKGQAQRAAEAAPDLQAVGLNYHLTPDDGKADASDQVTLNP